MQPLQLTAGRCFYGLFLIGIGLQHFLSPGFRPFLVPDASGISSLSFLGIAFGVLLFLAGLAICINFKTRAVSLGVGALLLLLFLGMHLPYQVKHNPQMLGVWTNPLKCLAFSGGAFIIASYARQNIFSNNATMTADKLFLTGLFFFCGMLVVFGLMHFVYADFVATLVPSWIPAPMFCTIAAGALLVSSGLALLFRLKPDTVALLLGIMLFLWVIVLHIPRAVAAPATDNGNELTSVFQALGFSGIAFVLASLFKKSSTQNLQKKELQEMLNGAY